MASMQAYQDRVAPSRLELLYGLMAFWTYESAFFVLVRPGAAEGAEFRTSDPLARAANIAVLCGVVVLAWRQRGMAAYLARHGRMHALIILYCLASAAWSLYPAVSARRAISLATCFGFGFCALVTYGPRGAIRLYGWSLFLAAAASFAAIPVFGGRVFDNDAVVGGAAVRAFHGVFPQKNELSVEMLMGLCCWAYLGILEPRADELERRLWPVALLFILGALLLSKGATSILAALLILVVVVRFRFPNWRMRLLIRAGAVGATVALVATGLTAPEILFGLVGKDASLTGRIPLWIESAQAALARPLLGYGYGGFWNPDARLTQHIWVRIGWTAPNAHNGLLELALEQGLLGAGLYLFMLVRFALRGLRGLRDPGFPEAKFLALISVALLIENLDEGTTGWPDALAITTAFATALTGTWLAGQWPVPFAGTPEPGRPALRAVLAARPGALR